MGAVRKIWELCRRYNQYLLLITIFVISSILFRIAGLFEHQFSDAMSIASYLTWHNIFEFASILVSFAVFSVSYYTYEQTGKLRSIYLGSVFLFSGMIDAFHTLSFKGMPDFFIANDGANRATTFWIIARFTAAIGFVIASSIGQSKKTAVNKRLFSILPLTFSILTFVVVTYAPYLLPAMYIDGVGLTQVKKCLEYLIIVLLLVTIFRFVREYKKTGDYLVIWFSAALLVGTFSELAFVMYKDVHNIYNYLGHVYKVISFYIIFRIIFIYEVKKPYIELSAAKNEINEYAENLDRLVDKRTNELKKMNQKLLDDLEYARDIQKAILPSVLPREAEVGFSAKYFPAERVSGDFYNVFKLDDNNIGMYIGDVAGHGVPAAMLTVFLNQSIKTIKELNDSHWEIIKPSQVLKSIYESFNSTNFKEDIYIVLLYAIYNIKDRVLTYSSAGINVSPIIMTKDGKVKEIEIKGFPICKFIEFYNAEYTDDMLKLNSGEKIIFYTDGLVEAENSDGERFTEERLCKVLEGKQDLSGSELNDEIEEQLFGFIGNNSLKDDITYFVMEVK